jgi:hypothetical protein
MSTYDRDKRSRAAKWGWQLRRSGPTPEMLLGRRIHALLKTADPRLGRLYVCDQAAAAMRHVANAESRGTITAALAVARAYANGQATDGERLRATRSLRPLIAAREAQSAHYSPADCVLDAAGFALDKYLPHAIEWGAYWAARAVYGRDVWSTFLTELFAALETMQPAQERRQTA